MKPFPRIATFSTASDFIRHAQSLGLNLPCDEQLLAGSASPLLRPMNLSIAGKVPGNRIVIHPMEGWDGTSDGSPTEALTRRWRRFGESGAKLIWGGEAMAVLPEARANPNQLIIAPSQTAKLASLITELKAAHREHHGSTNDLVVGFQLTHSGRFCRPNDHSRWEPRVAFRHPLLDAKFKVSDEHVLTDADVQRIISAFISAAAVARDAGADFIDIKHCHGYLLHEFLAAHSRPGPFGGSFENRTRILREIVQGIRSQGNDIALGVRLSIFDFVPHQPDPSRAEPGKLGPGIPMPHAHLLPYRYAFGINPQQPTQYDLTETIQFAQLCHELGIQLINTSAGSPYYVPHIQRPAMYPPSDGYQPPHDPLIDVVRQIQATAELKAKSPQGMQFVGSAYSYLQEYLPNVAQAAIKQGWVDAVGLGRVVLSYPKFLHDAASTGQVQTKLICRTFSDCTTAPRNGLPSGCYPLDPYYKHTPQALSLRDIKRRLGG